MADYAIIPPPTPFPIAGRSQLQWTLASTAAIQATETQMTVTMSRDGAATTTFTSYTITSGKRLRLSAYHIGIILTTGTAISRNRIGIRFNAAGVVTTSSPLQAILEIPSVDTTTKKSEVLAGNFPDGIEYLGDGTAQIGITWISPDWVSATTICSLTFTISAFEY